MDDARAINGLYVLKSIAPLLGELSDTAIAALERQRETKMGDCDCYVGYAHDGEGPSIMQKSDFGNQCFYSYYTDSIDDFYKNHYTAFRYCPMCGRELEV